MNCKELDCFGYSTRNTLLFHPLEQRSSPPLSSHLPWLRFFSEWESPASVTDICVGGVCLVVAVWKEIQPVEEAQQRIEERPGQSESRPMSGDRMGTGWGQDGVPMQQGAAYTFPS